MKIELKTLHPGDIDFITNAEIRFMYAGKLAVLRVETWGRCHPGAFNDFLRENNQVEIFFDRSSVTSQGLVFTPENKEEYRKMEHWKRIVPYTHLMIEHDNGECSEVYEYLLVDADHVRAKASPDASLI